MRGLGTGWAVALLNTSLLAGETPRASNRPSVARSLVSVYLALLRFCLFRFLGGSPIFGDKKRTWGPGAPFPSSASGCGRAANSVWPRFRWNVTGAATLSSLPLCPWHSIATRTPSSSLLYVCAIRTYPSRHDKCHHPAQARRWGSRLTLLVSQAQTRVVELSGRALDAP
jgi:hypothetical protein